MSRSCSGSQNSGLMRPLEKGLSHTGGIPMFCVQREYVMAL